MIGKVAAPHGIKGEIMVYPLTDDVNRFFDLDYFLIEDKKYELGEIRIHKGQALILSPQITDRNDAEKLKGKFIEVYREDAVPLEEGQYFIEDLKGLKVKDISGDKEGILIDVISSGAVDVLVVKVEGAEMMMPFLKADVYEVNLKAGYMIADMTKLIC